MPESLCSIISHSRDVSQSLRGGSLWPGRLATLEQSLVVRVATGGASSQPAVWASACGRFWKLVLAFRRTFEKLMPDLILWKGLLIRDTGAATESGDTGLIARGEVTGLMARHPSSHS